MKAMPMILGACMLAPLAGGFAGSAISTTPLKSGESPLATIPRYASGFDGNTMLFGATGGADHYPLVTLLGTIPVEDLILHGLLRGRYDELRSDRDVYIGELQLPELDADGATAPETSASDGPDGPALTTVDQVSLSDDAAGATAPLVAVGEVPAALR